MEISLKGRKALITGGSLGLGRAMAIRFAQSGADVAIAARRQDVLDEAKAEIEAAAPSATITTHAGDVGDANDVARTYAEIISAHGNVDILVNNAGRAAAKPFEKVTDAEWQADLDLKLFAAIRLTRLALPGMKERNWGRIINVLNVGAKAAGALGAPTSVSRAAGMALTKILSKEGAAHNVLVNALLVGVIRSDQIQRGFDAAKTNESMDDYFAKRFGNLPMGRIGEAEEFANIACFLVSDAASYITGTAINVDGGMSPVV